MNSELKKLIRMVQPKQPRFIRMRDEILCQAMSASDKGLKFLQGRYVDLMALYNEAKNAGQFKINSQDGFGDFPPIPDDIAMDLPFDLPRSGGSGPTVEFDLTPYANTELKLTYKDDEINTSADELWALLRGIVEDWR